MGLEWSGDREKSREVGGRRAPEGSPDHQLLDEEQRPPVTMTPGSSDASGTWKMRGSWHAREAGTPADQDAASASLVRSMAELSAMIQSMPDGVYVGTNDGITIANQRGLELLGARTVEELPAGAAAVMARLLHRDARTGRPLAAGEEPFLRALRGERSVRELLARHLGRAQDRVLRTAAAPIEVDGVITGAVAVTSDITELVRARETKSALAEAGRLLASSLDCAAMLEEVMPLLVPRFADYVMVDGRDESGGYRQIAAAHADRRHRYLLDELALLLEARGAPEHVEDFAGDLPPVPGERHALLASGVDDAMLDILIPDPGERAIHRRLAPHSFVVAPLVAHGRTVGRVMAASTRPDRPIAESERKLFGELATRIALAIDVARLHAAEQRARTAAEAASQAKSAFMATMSHEIRTPINAIMGYTELIELGLSGPLTAKQRHQLSRIQVSSRHLLSLVNDVLDLAKVESGRLGVTRDAAEVATAVGGALTLVQPQAASREILLSSSCHESEAVRYMGDPNRVEQILVNLLANAERFTEPGGSIAVSCELVPPSVASRAGAQLVVGLECACAIHVRDTGIGIAHGHLSAIFEPFVQVDSGHTRTREGTGLGLAISRRLARLMGGDLTVESEPGHGSCFTLWLPGVPVVSAGGGEVPAACTIVDRRDAARLAAGLMAVRDTMMDEVDPMMKRLVARLRADDGVPTAAALGDAELQGHIPTLVTDMLQSLAIVEESNGAATPLMRDASAIQRVIADRHGSMRRMSGFGEAEVQREFELLRDELSRSLRDRASSMPAHAEALLVLQSLLDRVEATGMVAYRRD